MRAVARWDLSDSTMATLARLATEVSRAADPKSRAAALWNAKPDMAFSEVRRTLQAMAGGRSRCMYCEDNEGTDIEHCIEVFDLNGDVRGRKLPDGRRDTLLKLQLLVLEYDRLVGIGDDTKAQQTKQTITREPFPAVLRFLIELAQRPVAELILRPGVPQAIRRHGVERW